MSNRQFVTSRHLQHVKYEIRGDLARRAQELERTGYEIIRLNIGNPGRFGFRTPETMRLAMIENLASSEAYGHQKGIFPAREAVVMQQQNRGIMDVNAEQVFMGNGVSELIDLTLRALLNPGDEVLVPSPDYPLWTAAVVLNGGKAVHYPCPPENGFQPDMEAVASLITGKTRALVIINPNNPTGAVYSRETLQAFADLAEKHQLMLMADEIYDQVLFDDGQHIPMASLVGETVCATFSGLSKVYRACGYRVGWVVFNGRLDHARGYLNAVETLASLRLCSNVPGQWAVQTALGGYQSIHELVQPGGRLYESRKIFIDHIASSDRMSLVKPMGAMYAFPEISQEALAGRSDEQFALDLLEKRHVLIVPGTSFNFTPDNFFRMTLLPEPRLLETVFQRIDDLLDDYATA